jgi:uncharacterized protein
VKRHKRALLTAVLTIAIAYLAICVAVYTLQRKLIYHPTGRVEATPTDIGLEYREFQLLSTDSVRFVVWQIPQTASRSVVVLFHGNADNISRNLDLYRTWYNLGASVVAFEYRGYLGGEGEPTEAGIERDLAVLADSLRTWYPSDSVKVIAMGRSLGGAVAAKLARIYPVSGLILESTFPSMADMGMSRFPFLPVALLLRERFDTESILHQLNIPVLVIHSGDDEIVPFHLGRKLYNAANEPKQFVEIEGDHNSGVDISRTQLVESYRQFLLQLTMPAESK